MTIRPLEPDDVDHCLAIVDEVWDFSGTLHPAALATFALRLYVHGSLAQSRYATVIEAEGGVEAFIFGAAGTGDRIRTDLSGVMGPLRTMAALVTMRGLGPGEKVAWLRDVVRHERSRAAVDPIGPGEVTLFAAAPAAQGRGFGRALMDHYVDHCRSLGVDRVTLETDVQSSYGFYDRYGFGVVGEFISPMNRRFGGGSGRSFVYALAV